MNAAAAFVTLIAVVAIFSAGLIVGGWLSVISHIQRSEWQELDDFERAQVALRHPSFRLDDADGLKGGE